MVTYALIENPKQTRYSFIYSSVPNYIMDLKYSHRTSELWRYQKLHEMTTSKQCAKYFYEPQNLIKQYQIKIKLHHSAYSSATTTTVMILWDFLILHHKWLSIINTVCMSCPTRCWRLKTWDPRKLGNTRKIWKLHKIID